MNRKPAPKSILSQLTAEQQLLILKWLETQSYQQVVNRIAAPSPEGFGLKTHVTSLRRFYVRHQKASEPPTPADLLDPEVAAATLHRPEYASEEDYLKAIDTLQVKNAYLLCLQARTDFKAFLAAARFIMRRDEAKFTQYRLEMRGRMIDHKNKEIEIRRQIAETKAKTRLLIARTREIPPASFREIPPKTHLNPTPNTQKHTEIKNSAQNIPPAHRHVDCGVSAPLSIHAFPPLNPASPLSSAPKPTELYFPPPDLLPSPVGILSGIFPGHSAKNTPQPHAKHTKTHQISKKD